MPIQVQILEEELLLYKAQILEEVHLQLEEETQIAEIVEVTTTLQEGEVLVVQIDPQGALHQEQTDLHLLEAQVEVIGLHHPEVHLLEQQDLLAQEVQVEVQEEEEVKHITSLFKTH